MNCSLRVLVYVYLLGGITFIPIILIAAFLFIYYTSPLKTTVEKRKAAQNSENVSVPAYAPSADDLKDEDELEGVDAHKVGWLRVNREYEGNLGKVGPDKIPGNKEGKYMSRMKSLLDRPSTMNDNGNGGFPKSKSSIFFAVLKHGNLFLYETEEQLDVKHVIVLAHFQISIWPVPVSEDEIFLKASAVTLTRKKTDEKSIEMEDIPKKSTAKVSDPSRTIDPPDHSYFLFPSTNSEKEDWYFALLRASKPSTGIAALNIQPSDPSVAAIPQRFEPQHMFTLIQNIHSSDAHLQTRWLNALIGRVFLGTYRTVHMENYFIQKISKKIARVKKPAFLSDIKVKRVRLGDQAPIFTHPRLRELSSAGDFVADVHVTYEGGFRIEIGTVATLQLGNRFKPRQIGLELAVTIKKLEGTLQIKMKRPPTNRLWYGFYENPKMELSIEPIVSQRQITYTMVLKAIENRIREAVYTRMFKMKETLMIAGQVQESIVLPNQDDTAIIPTFGEIYRGGIWQRQPDKDVGPSDNAPEVGDVEKGDEFTEGTAKIPMSSAVDDLPGENSSFSSSIESPNIKNTIKTSRSSKTAAKRSVFENEKTRPGRSKSFTSFLSAPAVVAADAINVESGTPADEKRIDWAAEAAARAIAARMKGDDDADISRPISPLKEVVPEQVRSADVSVKSFSSIEGDKMKSATTPPITDPTNDKDIAAESASPSKVSNYSSPASTPSLADDNISIASVTSSKAPEASGSKGLALTGDKEALSTRVSQTANMARDAFKLRFNSYMTKRNQNKQLQKQILSSDRLVNSPKMNTRMTLDESATNGSRTGMEPQEEDIDSGPLPFEAKPSPRNATFPTSAPVLPAQSPAYGPSARMMIPHTMASVGSSTPSPEPPETSTESSPKLSDNSKRRPVPPPPLPARSPAMTIPRRPVPPIPPSFADAFEGISPPDNSRDSSLIEDSKDEEVKERKPETEDRDEGHDLMVLHISSEEDEEGLLHLPQSPDKNGDLSYEKDKRVENTEDVPKSVGVNRVGSVEDQLSVASSWGSRGSGGSIHAGISDGDKRHERWEERDDYDSGLTEMLEQVRSFT